MKIAIPVDEKDLNTTVCVSFGRAPFFMIYDTTSKQYDFLDNSAAASSGGAGIKASQSIVNQGVEVLITPRCGENAADVLKAADIQMYQSKKGLGKDNVALYLNDGLSPLSAIHEGFHNHGGK
ncbi:NifB/NifX family molybdenum-iron cluster-binding protein [Fusibacter paucivorans]|uniref:NifB/NifX family molybdenum-iron cluster-binding protein n=1 Tax=Fusibacter paucivorans TaxID=76009 RepID=A0ABS5PQB9_9FIRM|nr:NifB/NifX family molybdenum-iron cluster-binding protein [Fusibacter paucivorans]MBS7526786.1 NifB/NifX family molybdenum-iron cluster-binding protein [Fusibacter paucivorans]